MLARGLWRDGIPALRLSAGTPLARLIWYLRRAYFQPDFELIEQVRNLTSSTEVRLELNRVRYYHPATGSFADF